MTSANVTYFNVYDQQGKTVLQTSQHAYCKNTVRQQFQALANPEQLTITATWPDEEEVRHDSEPLNLAAYLKGEQFVYPTLMDSHALYEENKELKAQVELLKTELAQFKTELAHFKALCGTFNQF